MIRNEVEYREAVERLQGEQERLRQQRAALAARGLGAAEAERVAAPLQSFHEQLREEIESYERLRRGQFNEVLNFDGMGRLLIALRIYEGLTQRELAERLGVQESQVSRDERNEYHGITLERAARVLDALGAQVRTTVLAPPGPRMVSPETAPA
jgi:DNA-directed RNA polymerase specialized sigma subunit